jgi:SAM-dependent methyltransferase
LPLEGAARNLGPMTKQSHHHAQGHHGDDFDWAAMAAHLEREGEVSLPCLTAAAQWLRGLKAGTTARRVLDVGSGPGVAACLLAETFPAAEVVAVDGSGILLERAGERAAGAGLDKSRFRTLEVELPEGFGALGRADLIWTSRAVHHLGDQQDAVDHLAAALEDGGLLAVSEGGLPLRFLPRDIGLGRPGLAARLDAAYEERFTAMRAGLPHTRSTVEDWPAMLRRAGLTPTGSRTFVTDLPAPLGDRARDYLHTHLARARAVLTDRLAEDDLNTLDALLADGTPESIRSRPDAFCLSATTVHTAVRPVR